MPHPNFIDLTGKIFNRLTVLERAKNSKRGKARWKCLCECGNITVVQGSNLTNGTTKSCDCFASFLKKERKFIHGMSHTGEHNSWCNMKDRCLNPRNQHYKDYGGRGIKIYTEWIESFQAFFDYVGLRPTPKHTIERINNGKNYFPGNVKWSTRKQQANNTRTNHPITINGITLNLCQWAKKVGINQSTISKRIHAYGWPPEKAIFEPVKHR